MSRNQQSTFFTTSKNVVDVISSINVDFFTFSSFRCLLSSCLMLHTFEFRVNYKHRNHLSAQALPLFVRQFEKFIGNCGPDFPVFPVFSAPFRVPHFFRLPHSSRVRVQKIMESGRALKMVNFRAKIDLLIVPAAQNNRP